MSKYDDIIGLPHHVSATRTPMPLEKRAAQFAPFAVMSGYGEAIDALSRPSDERIELAEDEKEALSRQLAIALETGAEVSITYYLPRSGSGGRHNSRGSCGTYISARGRIARFDGQRKALLMSDGGSIPLHDIIGIEPW